jgi:hypothetical protein
VVRLEGADAGGVDPGVETGDRLGGTVPADKDNVRGSRKCGCERVCAAHPAISGGREQQPVGVKPSEQQSLLSLAEVDRSVGCQGQTSHIEVCKARRWRARGRDFGSVDHDDR